MAENKASDYLKAMTSLLKTRLGIMLEGRKYSFTVAIYDGEKYEIMEGGNPQEDGVGFVKRLAEGTFKEENSVVDYAKGIAGLIVDVDKVVLIVAINTVPENFKNRLENTLSLLTENSYFVREMKE